MNMSPLPELIHPQFIHLRVHSAFSLLEGALKIDKIVAQAVADGQPAIAITDSGNMFGALEFSLKCLEKGIQPLIGCQLAIDFADEEERTNRGQAQAMSAQWPQIVLLAANEQGYENLVTLVSKSYLDNDDEVAPHIEAAWLAGLGEGIIALTGGANGGIDRALANGKPDLACRRVETLTRAFGNRLYVEIQRHHNYDRQTQVALVDLAYSQKLPLVATNEAFFLEVQDYEAHDALLAVAEGQLLSNEERRRVTSDHYLKNQADMVALFADLPEALENTIEIARRCHIHAPTRKPILPRFTMDEGDDPLKVEAQELVRQAHDGLKRRLELIGVAEGHTSQEYQERLDYELGIIEKMQFPGYFLIVADFIKWAKAHHIPVGPGRGSGAGSLVAYALTITDIDPLRFSLLFERFLNPDRVSMPDFDIDFCQDRREEVIRYVQEKYGRDQVAQIITFGSLQARAVLRDVGRVLEMPYHQVDRLCKLVPSNPAKPTPLAQAVKEEPKFQEEQDREPVVARLLDIAQKLEGLYRHASTHAAGIVIGDRPLWRLVPMYRDPRSNMPVTQFNMKYVEQAGLVKFDFLGLKTLTVLQKAIELIARTGVNIDLACLPLDDALTYQMMARGETVGVFQIEGAGMRKALIGMKPDRIEDIIALVALYRPGPMENIPTYNARKHGEEEIASIHPKIDHLVKETQGVIVYQEQVMQIAQELAGYSLGEADLLRRAMGKKIRSEMDQQRERFVSGAVEAGVGKAQADLIFDLLAKFADYGFNKSHAAAYALVSYQTAYLKAHHPVEFLASSMSYDMSNTDKLNDFRREAERLGIKVVPPSVQTSYADFEVGENCIYYALAAIKGVGEMAAAHIAQMRGTKPFADLEDFCQRTDPRLMNRRVWESLIFSGCFDGFGISREQLASGIDVLLARAQRHRADQNNGQFDIFGLETGIKEPLILPEYTPWLPAQKLQKEFVTVGFYLSAHPLDDYKICLDKMRVQTHADFVRAVQRGATAGRLAGTINSKQIRKTRTGNRMGIIQLSDASGQYEAVIFSENLVLLSDLLEVGQSVILNVAAEERPEGISLRIEGGQALEEAATKMGNHLRLYINCVQAARPISIELEKQEGGEGEVSLILIKQREGQEIEIALKPRYTVGPQLVAMLKTVKGVMDAELF